jgi:hypothetical protein
MAQLNEELIDALLREQDLEFSTEFSHVSLQLASVINDMPEAGLLAAGEKLIESVAASRRILGIRLLRELKRLAEQAAPIWPGCCAGRTTTMLSTGSSAHSGFSAATW